MFLSYKQIEYAYGSVENFLDDLIHRSAGCSFHADQDGISFHYDYDTYMGNDNSGYVVTDRKSIGFNVSVFGFISRSKKQIVEKYLCKNKRHKEWC